MADQDTTTSSAPVASKPKKTRNKITTEQRIARLEQQLARAQAEQRETSRKLQTRGKIILGAAFLGYLNSLPADRHQKPLDKLIPFITTERDRKALLDSGLLPDSVTLNNTSDNTSDTGSESGEKS